MFISGHQKNPTPRFTTDSIAEAGTNHLFGSLILNPSLADKVRQSALCPTWSLLGAIGHTDRLVHRWLNVGDHMGIGS